MRKKRLRKYSVRSKDEQREEKSGRELDGKLGWVERKMN